VDSPQDREALAALLYTAGTSGQPKAAMLSHRALLSHVDHIDILGILDAAARVLAVLPLFHVFGLNAVLGSWIRAGATLVVVDGADSLIDTIEAERPTNLPLAPSLLHRLLDDPRCATALTSVTTVLSGAAPLTAELAAAFEARTGIRVEQGYGMTEAAPGISVTLGGDAHGHGHVGRPLPGVDVRIGDGAEPTEPGEIWVRGDNLFSGYWPDGRDGPDADGWFATGDIGYLEAGELFLVDRARELIIVNGFNVYPAEVEEAIAGLAGVDAVAVVGRPDPRTGEEVVAFVLGHDITEADVVAHCAARLAKFKRPGLVQLVDELPRGATGKVKKGVLRGTVESSPVDPLAVEPDTVPGSSPR
jgi:long-chain acyl-CoA synthetase